MDNVNALTGTASYSGEAVGAHHKTGEGVNVVRPAMPSLTANFMDNRGRNHRGVDLQHLGGWRRSDVDSNQPGSLDDHHRQRHLQRFAVMGAQTRPAVRKVHSYNGTWSGGFFNNPPTARSGPGDDQHPGSVAGTFGVTRDDDMGTTTGANPMADGVTESFVGAFGAHKN